MSDPALPMAIELDQLRQRLAEAEEALRAIAHGEVDALVIPGAAGDQIFSLQGAEEPYRELVETMSQGAAVLAPDGTILYSNQRLAALLRVPLERLTGTSFTPFVTPGDRPRVEARLAGRIREGLADETSLTAGGRGVPVLIAYSHPDGFGGARINLVVTDLTEQKRQEEAKASAFIRQAALDAILGQVAVLDGEGRIVVVNEPWRAWGGADLGEGVDYRAALVKATGAGDAFAAAALAGLESVLEGRQASFETASPRGDRARRWFRMLVTRLEGGLEGAVIVYQDITEKVALEETHLFLARARWLGDAEDSFQALARFLANQLGMALVQISRLTLDLESAVPLATWLDGRAVPAGPFALKHTPGGDLRGRRALLWIPSGLRQQYPEDERLAPMGAESFLGMTLWGVHGQPIGLLTLKGRESMADSHVAEAILSVVAERAAGELECRVAEEARGRAEADVVKLSTALEQSPVAVVIADTAGDIEYVNPSFTAVTGYLATEVVGRNPRILKGDLTPAEDYREMWARLQAGQVWRGEFHNRRKNGELYWEQASISPIRDDRGVITSYVAVKEDITERRQAEVRLRETLDFNQTLLDAYPMGVLAYHAASGRCVLATQGAAQAVGTSVAELLTQDFRALASWRRAGLTEVAEQVLASGQERYLEVEMQTSFGNPIAQACHFTTFVASGERHVLLLMMDIGKRRQAERDNAQFQAHLIQAQKMESLGSLSGGVAHDMNNVLGAILALAEHHARTQPEGSPAQAAFATILEAATRGGRMVKSLLNFARRQPEEERELDLNGILREWARILERTTLARVRLDLELAPDLRPIVGDGSALGNAFMNLCVNAVDAMPAGGTLTVRTRNLDDGGVEIRVADTGCGMTKEVLGQAMDPFFTTKGVGKGTGLGLALVYSTVKAHQGQVALESEPGRGTQVILTLPAARPSAAPAPRPDTAPAPEAPSPQALPAREQRRMHILMVDDDELIRRSTELLLGAFGHTVTAVASGEEALALLEGGLRPERVLMDLNMPGLGGAGTLPALRRLCPDLPVVLITGRADDAARALVDTHGKVALLAKPFTLDDLQAQMAQA